MLQEIGLDVPFSVKIAELLKRNEIHLQNTHLTMESLVNELWRLHSKKSINHYEYKTPFERRALLM